MKLMAVLVLPMLLFAACSRPAEPQFEPRIVELRTGPCGENGQVDCAGVRVEYPACTAAPADEICERIDRAVAAWVTRSLDGTGASFESAGALTERFLRNHREAQERAPDARHTWSMERTVRVTYQSPEAISLSALESGYTGGPNPFSSLTYLTFRASTGEPLILGEILVDGGRERLNEVGETYFRQARRLAAGSDLAEEGFRFSNGRFTLPDNFAFSRVGLQFHFNVDDLASYPAGETDVTIPYGEAAVWLRPEFQQLP